MTLRMPLVLLSHLVLLTSSVGAQSAADHIAAGDRDHDAKAPAAALAHYEAAIAVDRSNFEALWKASREAADLGEFASSESERAVLSGKGEEYARRAVVANRAHAEGHFQLARAIGRRALTLGSRERVSLAAEIHDHATEALRLEPRHPGALHVMGMWHANVMRLNAIARTVARRLLGGRVFGEASWDRAQQYMEAAVAAAPEGIVHRLDLARVYADRGATKKAREQLQWIARAEEREYNDPTYKRLAAEELKALPR